MKKMLILVCGLVAGSVIWQLSARAAGGLGCGTFAVAADIASGCPIYPACMGDCQYTEANVNLFCRSTSDNSVECVDSGKMTLVMTRTDYGSCWYSGVPASGGCGCQMSSFGPWSTPTLLTYMVTVPCSNS